MPPPEEGGIIKSLFRTDNVFQFTYPVPLFVIVTSVTTSPETTKVALAPVPDPPDNGT